MEFKYAGSEVNQRTILNHPAGLFVLFFTEMWERFSYYGMRAILVLFLTSSVIDGGWAWSRENALELYATYTGLVYITPIFGGLLADKLLGYRNAVILGALVMTLGHASMAFDTSTAFYIGLALLIIGNGLFKPNISSIVGQLYKTEGKEKDAGYTIFYMGINAGAFLGMVLCGYVGEQYSWSLGFGLAGIFMFLGMLQFFFAQKIFGKIGLTNKERLKHEAINGIGQVEEKAEVISPKVKWDRIFVIFVFSISTIFFWWAFEQQGGSMTIFARDYTNRVLTGAGAKIFSWSNAFIVIVPLAIITYVLILLFKKIFNKYPLSNLFLGFSFVIIWGIVLWMVNNQITNESTEIPASWFSSLNSLFIIILAPLFSMLWESKLNPSGPIKFGIGLILVALSFAVLSFGASGIELGSATASVSIFWLIGAYFLQTSGELCVSPVGLSYVSKLSPKSLVGFMFGIWFTCTAIANFIAGITGSYIDKINEEYGMSTFFLIFAIISAFAGLIMILINKFLIKKMHGIH